MSQIIAGAAGQAYFFKMPSDDKLLQRALDRTPDELRHELSKVIADLEQRIEEGGTPEQLEAKREQLAAAKRSLARLPMTDEEIRERLAAHGRPDTTKMGRASLPNTLPPAPLEPAHSKDNRNELWWIRSSDGRWRIA